jgi:hypothetical protein
MGISDTGGCSHHLQKIENEKEKKKGNKQPS